MTVMMNCCETGISMTTPSLEAQFMAVSRPRESQADMGGA